MNPEKQSWECYDLDRLNKESEDLAKIVLKTSKRLTQLRNDTINRNKKIIKLMKQLIINERRINILDKQLEDAGNKLPFLESLADKILEVDLKIYEPEIRVRKHPDTDIVETEFVKIPEENMIHFEHKKK